VYDAQRWRDIPLHIYLPRQKTPAPVLLFSRGLGGSPAQISLCCLFSAWGYPDHAVLEIPYRFTYTFFQSH
jgi:hypothetical protein